MIKNRKRVSISFDPAENKTVGYYKDECDLNLVMKKFRNLSDVMRSYDASGFVYDDFSNVTDYRTSIERMREANEVFSQMPSDLRAHFNNDIATFLDKVHDESSKEILKKHNFLRQSTSQESQQSVESALGGE